jgi:hypothetical protein
MRKGDYSMNTKGMKKVQHGWKPSDDKEPTATKDIGKENSMKEFFPEKPVK